MVFGRAIYVKGNEFSQWLSTSVLKYSRAFVVEPAHVCVSLVLCVTGVPFVACSNVSSLMCPT